MKKYALILFVIIVPACFAQAGLAELDRPGLESIKESEIEENLSYLASDSLKGRSTGSKENLAASVFIAKKFYEYGLKPVFENRRNQELESVAGENGIDVSKSFVFDGYFQKYNLKRSSLSDNNKFSIIENGADIKKIISYDYNIDFLVQYNGANNISITAPVVFAGYGIFEGPDGYSDYKNPDGSLIDIKNKIVVIIDGYPRESDPGSSFNKKRSASYLNVRTKSEYAMNNGAAAVILVSSPLKAEPPLNLKYERLTVSFEREFYHLPELNREAIPVIYISKSAAVELFRNTGIDLNEVTNSIEKTLTPSPSEIKNKKVSFEVNFENALIPTQNICGLIEGSDSSMRGEVIVIGAHMDHVGFGEYGAMNQDDKGKIHNGADDNASGTCGMLELAEAFSKSKPKRSILFVAFNAEENGILGSRYYAYVNPVMPLENTVAMINLDMIGRNEPELLWVGGPFYGDDVKNIVEDANKSVGFELLYNVGLLNFASDQGPFLRKEIPSIFFFAGLHDDYHTPGDDIEKLNTEKIEKVSKLAYITGKILSDNKIYPKYRPLNMEEKTALVKESLERQRKFRGETEKKEIN